MGCHWSAEGPLHRGSLHTEGPLLQQAHLQHHQSTRRGPRGDFIFYFYFLFRGPGTSNRAGAAHFPRDQKRSALQQQCMQRYERYVARAIS